MLFSVSQSDARTEGVNRTSQNILNVTCSINCEKGNKISFKGRKNTLKTSYVDALGLESLRIVDVMSVSTTP